MYMTARRSGPSQKQKSNVTARAIGLKISLSDHIVLAEHKTEFYIPSPDIGTSPFQKYCLERDDEK